MEFRSSKHLLFTPEEDELLISLVSQHRNIIDIKITDANGWREKQGVWGKIATLHEQKTGVSRSTRSLKNRYSYLKRSLRKKITNEGENLSRTGDVPSHLMKLNSNEEQLLHILKEHVVGMGNDFDDDRIDVQTTTTIPTPFTIDEIKTITFNKGVILETDGQQPGIQTVKVEKDIDIEPLEAENPLSSPSYQHKHRRETATAQELAKAKVDLLESEKRIKLEQHESKKQIKLEAHKMKQALRKAKLDLLQAKLRFLVAKTIEIEEKETKCDECK